MSERNAGRLKRYFLPNIFQVVGYIIAITGFILTFLRFSLGIKPGFLNVKVFAIYSTYFDTKYLRFIDNNISEEICGITVLAGLFLVVFSREKKEMDHYWVLRLKAFIISTYLSVFFLLLSFLFIYGIAFMSMLSLNIILPLLLYILIFRYSVVKDHFASQNT